MKGVLMSLEKYRWDLIACERCNNCMWMHPWKVKNAQFAKNCPSAERYLFAAYSCQGRFDLARGLLDGEIGYSEKFLDAIFRCTLCGACDVSCKYYRDMEPIEILQELRNKCVEDGYGPLPHHKPIIDSVKTYDNVWMQPRSKRGAWTKRISIKDINKDRAKTLFYVGCTYALKPELHEVVKKTARVLQMGDINFGILGNQEVCCGSPILKAGEKKLFEKIARENLEQFNKLKIEEMVTSCAGCYGVFKDYYPRVGEMNFKVFHVVEYFEKLLKEGKLRFTKEVPLIATWHDPCHLGRMGEPYVPWEGKRGRYGLYEPPRELNRGTFGIYESPREVLKNIPGIELVEMDRNREWAWCCGAGGGVKSAFPDFALWCAQERIKEAEATGAEAMVTSCPWCESNLTDALGEGEMKMFSLIDIMTQAIEEGMK
jgi:Fe-S oxidoreductase